MLNPGSAAAPMTDFADEDDSSPAENGLGAGARNGALSRQGLKVPSSPENRSREENGACPANTQPGVGVVEPVFADEPDIHSPLGFASFVRRHHAAVYRYALHLCGVVADAEDLTQQTFLVAREKAGQIREADKSRAWLYAVLRGCFSRLARKNTPIAAANLELNVDEIPADAAGTAIDSEELQAALKQLPDDQRVVVLMFYYEDLSYKQIAEELRVPIGTVMSRLSRAKGALRRLLDHGGD